MYDTINRRQRWELRLNKLIFKHPEMEVYWEVPEDFTMPSLKF